METDQSPTSPYLIRLPRPLRNFLLLSILITACCAAVEVFCKLVLGMRWPYTNTLLPGHYEDFKLLCPQFAYYHQLRFFGPTTVLYSFMYPATVGVFYEAFCSVPRYSIGAVEALIACSFLVPGWMLGRRLVRSGLRPIAAMVFVLASLAFSYPFWFEVRQANMEIVVWVFVASGLYAYFQGKLHVAAMLFGIAASLKIFPLVYLGLFLARGRYKYIGTALLTGAVFTVVAQWMLYPDLAVSCKLTMQGLERFRNIVMLREIDTVTGFDHSLFGLYKRVMPALPSPHVLGRLLSIYLAICTVLGVLLFWFRIRTLPVINQVLSLTVASILFPPTSFDYTLVHLYGPWALMVLLAVASWKSGAKTPGLSLSFICMAIVMSPESEFIHNGLRFGGQIKAVALLALFALSLIFPFPREGKIAERAWIAGSGADPEAV